MSSARRPCLVLTCLLIPLVLTTGIRGQTGVTSAASSSAAASHKRLGISLFGGWASFSQTRVNNLIRMDNLLLTGSVEDGGAGLDRGLDQITDAVAFGIELRYHLKGSWEAFIGVERLQASSRIEFDYDSGSGLLDSYLEYGTDDWPIHAGLRYSFRFSERFSYGIGLAAVVFPASRLVVEGQLGGLAALDREGTVSGVGAALTWGGEMALSGPLHLQSTIRLRFGEAGNPKDSDGDVITDPLQGKPITLDWSGVDIVVGLLIDLF